MLTPEEVKTLILQAQNSDNMYKDSATSTLLADIVQHYMNHIIGKYKRSTRLIGSGFDAEDIEQIFLMACTNKGIRTARIDIGDPIMYILQTGKWAVLDALRSSFRKTIRQHCRDCFAETRLFETGGIPQCPQCASVKVERIAISTLDDGTVLHYQPDRTNVERMVLDKLTIEEFRNRLKGRKREVFDLILQGLDRDACKSYIGEIADTLGVSTSNINQRLRQIKSEWAQFKQLMG